MNDQSENDQSEEDTPQREIKPLSNRNAEIASETFKQLEKRMQQQDRTIALLQNSVTSLSGEVAALRDLIQNEKASKVGHGPTVQPAPA